MVLLWLLDLKVIDEKQVGHDRAFILSQLMKIIISFC